MESRKTKTYIDRVRTKTINECHLTDYIRVNNETCEIVDAYRTNIEKGGYTWGRQLCQSGLDYILAVMLLLLKCYNKKWLSHPSTGSSIR